MVNSAARNPASQRGGRWPMRCHGPPRWCQALIKGKRCPLRH